MKKKLAAVLLAAALVAIYIVKPRETMFWLETVTSPLIPPLSATVLSCIALWFLTFWASMKTRKEGIHMLLIPIIPLVFNIDLVLQGLYTVKVGAALGSTVGFWRFLLAFLAMAAYLAKSESVLSGGRRYFGPFYVSGYKLWGYSLLSLLTLAFFYCAVWAFIMFFSPEAGGPSWVIARYAGLMFAYTLASLANAFSAFMPAISGEPIALAAPFIYFATLTYAVCVIAGVARWLGPASNSDTSVYVCGIKLQGGRKTARRNAFKGEPADHQYKYIGAMTGRSTGGTATETSTGTSAGAAGGGSILGPTVEEPSPLSFFASDGGREAREAANRRELVALYYGSARWSLHGGKHEYFAIPESLAEKLLNGGTVCADEKRALEKWIQGGAIEATKEQDGFRVKAKDAKLASDIQKQLNRIRMLREYRKIALRKPDYVW